MEVGVLVQLQSNTSPADMRTPSWTSLSNYPATLQMPQMLHKQTDRSSSSKKRKPWQRGGEDDCLARDLNDRLQKTGMFLFPLKKKNVAERALPTAASGISDDCEKRKERKQVGISACLAAGIGSTLTGLARSRQTETTLQITGIYHSAVFLFFFGFPFRGEAGAV